MRRPLAELVGERQKGLVAPTVVVPAEFVPRCEDCRYDLSGLEDGRCPECGLRFTHRGLKVRWAARAVARQQRYKDVAGAAVVVAGVLSALFLQFGAAPGSALLLGVWTLIAVAWRAAYRRTWFLHAEVLLVYLLPLMFFAAVHSATPYGAYVALGAGVVASVIAWTALRNSPLNSAALLLGVAVAPMLIVAALMFWLATARVAGGHYWSDFDQPTPSGWRALPAAQSRTIAVWMALVACAIGAVVLMYTRRAMVRLRASGRGQSAAAPIVSGGRSLRFERER